MERGWSILGTANDYFWIVILTIVGGSFGSSSITKFIKKKVIYVVEEFRVIYCKFCKKTYCKKTIS